MRLCRLRSGSSIYALSSAIRADLAVVATAKVGKQDDRSAQFSQNSTRHATRLAEHGKMARILAMSLNGKARRVRIYVNEGDLVGHTPSYVAIVEFLRKENAFGATVYRAIEGFGSTGVVHTTRLVEVFQRLPLIIEWVDSAERVDRLLERIKQVVAHGLITVEDTEVVLSEPHPVHRISSHTAAQEVMSRDLASVSRDTPIRQVVDLMLDKIYRAVPVVEDGRPIGIITNSDLVSRGGLGARVELLPRLGTRELSLELDRLGETPKRAAEIMTPSPATVRDSTPLTQVAELMAHRHLKRLPVVDDQGLLVGMISRLDILRTVAEGFEREGPEPRAVGLNGSVPIAQAMRREVPTVYADTPVAEVLPAVFSTRLNRAVVVDRERRVVGIITDAELLERVTPSLRPSALHSLMHRLPFIHPNPTDLAIEQHATARVAADLMLTDVPTAFEQTPLGEALGPILRSKEKLVAVVDDQRRLVGILDRADILHALIEQR
jgi:CBS domain-containing protein